jgi:GGDEF domain-containing protein
VGRQLLGVVFDLPFDACSVVGSKHHGHDAFMGDESLERPPWREHERSKTKMQAFDHISLENLERRQWQLVALAVAVILILATGMSLLMYPAVFAQPVVLSGTTLRQAFFGFCALSSLLVSYIVDRQITITKLRKRLAEEKEQVNVVRKQASADLLENLPRFDHFRDRLAMEFRRASRTQQPLSLLTVKLKPSRQLAETAEVQTAYADAVKTLTRKLRGQDSIYVFAPGVFGIILPGANLDDANRVVDRLAEGLEVVACARASFAFDLQVFNYPTHAGTAREIEEAIRAMLPSDIAGAPKTETVTFSLRAP